MRHRIALLIITFGLPGCSSLMPYLQEGIEEAAKMNDAALDSAEFTICQGASIGSILRKFKTEEERQLWRAMCLKNASLFDEN